MKTWIAYILAFYILFSAVVPCCIIDHCGEEEHTQLSSDLGHEKDCNNCSPFSICSSAKGFTINSVHAAIAFVVIPDKPAYSEHYYASMSAYYSSLFQPPRVA